MVVIGQETQTRFDENDISDAAQYGRMKSEPLSPEGDPGTFVIPVRRKIGAPHLRTLSKVSQQREGASESNESHNKAIALLFKFLHGKRCKLITHIFDDDGVKDIQVLYDTKTAYRWWNDDEATKISFRRGKYIRPDLCGRDNNIFAANRKSRSLIIEVVNTHIPEYDTLRRLLELSEQNHIVIFYYVTSNSQSTQYNRFQVLKDWTEVRASYYLIDGKFYKNGEEIEPLNNKKDIAWYQNIKSRFFDWALANKK